jgi:hypothetical protein
VRAGRRKSLDLSRAIVLTLFLLRHDNVQDVAAELFGCSQATVSRTSRRIRPLLRQATTAIAQRVAARARLGAVLLDGLIAPAGERRDRSDLFSGQHRVCGMNVQVIADLDLLHAAIDGLALHLLVRHGSDDWAYDALDHYLNSEVDAPAQPSAS